MLGRDAESLPSGVVSLLFTDVEGSTRLWAADPDATTAPYQQLRDHVAALAAELVPLQVLPTRLDENRRKLDAEVAASSTEVRARTTKEGS